MAVAEDVRADLHHRRASVASGECRQVGFRRQARHLDASPLEILEAQPNADLLGYGRLGIVVKNDLFHRLASRPLRLC
jgi:hypothetical protein